MLGPLSYDRGSVSGPDISNGVLNLMQRIGLVSVKFDKTISSKMSRRYC